MKRIQLAWTLLSFQSVFGLSLNQNQVDTLVMYWNTLGWRGVTFENMPNLETVVHLFRKSSLASVKLTFNMDNDNSDCLVHCLSNKSSSTEIKNFLQKRYPEKMIMAYELDFNSSIFSSINVSSEFYLVTIRENNMTFHRCQTFFNQEIFVSNVWNLILDGGSTYHFDEQFDLLNAKLRFNVTIQKLF